MKTCLVLSILLSMVGLAQSPGTFTAAGNTTTARVLHSATVLANGKVLIAGGHRNINAPFANPDAELHDPSTGTFIGIGDLLDPATDSLSTTSLADGRVFIAGINAELYDPGAGRISRIFEVSFGYFP